MPDFLLMKFALRQLAKSPAFTAIAVLSLALGIGANTAVFSLVDDILLRSLPVRNPDELVLFRWHAGPNDLRRGFDGSLVTDSKTGLRTSTSLSHFIFERLRDHDRRNEVLTDLFAFARIQQLNVALDAQAEIASGQYATGGYFSGLGVTALRGRMLDSNDDRADAEPAAVISHRYWQQRFARSESAIGKTIRVNHLAVTIVGIAPEGFLGTLGVGLAPDVTLPMALEPRVTHQGSLVADQLYWWLHIMGRLRPGVTAAQAQAQLEPVLVQAARDAWLTGKHSGPMPALEGRALPKLQLEPGARGRTENAQRNFAPPLRVLMVIVGLVLLIACANVANLLLARSATRAKEIAVRLSVGATRARLVRQLLGESLVLSLCGGALGVLFALGGRAALLQLRPIIGAEPLALDWRMLGFTVAISVVTGLLFGLAPAWRGTRVDLNSVLKENSGGSIGRSRFTLRRGLMVAQIALSVVLLVGAGLFLRTLHNLRTLDAGFNRENLVLFRLDAGLSGHKGPQVVALFDRLLERLVALPGVRSAAHSRHALLSGGLRNGTVALQNPRLPANQNFGVQVNVVSPSFFPTFEIPFVLGRNFTDRDDGNSRPVAVINETFARAFFPEENPLGRTFTMNRVEREIVGVIRDARYADLRSAIPSIVYVTHRQSIEGSASFAVKTAGDPAALGAAIRTALREIDPNVPLFELRTQEQQINELVSNERMFATLSATLGGVALLLTCIGLYGLLAHQVTARTREIGIRMALGAQLRAVMALVLGEGLRLAALGVVLGLATALAVTRFVAHMLFGVPPTDPWTLAGAAALLIAIAALACFIPARRAAKVDPMSALRAE
jgi:predicted permease